MMMRRCGKEKNSIDVGELPKKSVCEMEGSGDGRVENMHEKAKLKAEVEADNETEPGDGPS